MAKVDDCPFAELIQSLQRQNSDLFGKVDVLARAAGNDHARIFGGNGDDSGSLATRVHVSEESMTKVETYIIEGRSARAERQKLMDERQAQQAVDQEKRNRDQEKREKRRDRRQMWAAALLAAVVTVAVARMEIRSGRAENAGRIPGNENRTEQVDSRV